MESITQRYLDCVEGKGYFEGLTFLDVTSKKPKCHRLGRVPYAQPITNSRRWKRAQQLPASITYGSEEKPTNFAEPSAVCPQAIYDLNRNLDPAQMSEDCLQCNIWIPIGKKPECGWPVWVYLRMSIISQ